MTCIYPDRTVRSIFRDYDDYEGHGAPYQSETFELSFVDKMRSYSIASPSRLRRSSALSQPQSGEIDYTFVSCLLLVLASRSVLRIAVFKFGTHSQG